MADYVDVDEELFTGPSTLPGAGQGLFTDRDIKKGERFTTYTGEELDRKGYEARYPNHDGRYVLQLSKNRFIDGRDPKTSSLARFANHKPRSRANARVNRNGVLLATKRIARGSEIFISYGAGYHIPFAANGAPAQ